MMNVVSTAITLNFVKLDEFRFTNFGFVVLPTNVTSLLILNAIKITVENPIYLKP